MRFLQAAAQEVPSGSSNSTTMRFVSSFSLICLFLYLGLQIRRIKLFRIFSLPASVSGGFIGLIFLQLCKLNPDVYELILYDWVVGWSALPGILQYRLCVSLLGEENTHGKRGVEIRRSSGNVWTVYSLG